MSVLNIKIYNNIIKVGIDLVRNFDIAKIEKKKINL